MKNKLRISEVDCTLLNHTGSYLLLQVQQCCQCCQSLFCTLYIYYELVVLTWGEDVRVEANVKRCVAD